MIKSAFNFFKSLVCDNGGGLSVGRVGLWILLYKAWMIIEIREINNVVIVTDIPPYLFGLIIVFVAYNFSKKKEMFIELINAAAEGWAKIK